MAQPIARDAEDFARLLLRTVERLGQSGDWISARDAFERAVAEHPDHAYLAHIAAKPGRRIGLSAITERLRAAEFPSIERRKAGGRRNAPVHYRVGPTPVALDLQLPHDVPASHPLVTRRRTAEAQAERATSARRAALTEREVRSPWRRRLLPGVTNTSRGVESVVRALGRWCQRELPPRVTGASQGVEDALHSLRRWCQRELPPRVSGAAQGVESTVRSLRGLGRQLRALGMTLAAGLTRR